jgi:hypothetical protein
VAAPDKGPSFSLLQGREGARRGTRGRAGEKGKKNYGFSVTATMAAIPGSVSPPSPSLLLSLLLKISAWKGFLKMDVKNAYIKQGR